MSKNGHLEKNEILALLEKIDQGYKPTKQERNDLAKVDSLRFWRPDEIKIIPESFSLLTGLTDLKIIRTQISNVDCLASLTNLKSLVLNCPGITDFSWLKNLKNLEKLDLSNTEISDTYFLKELTKLQELDLSYTQITSLDDLSELTSLKRLELYGNSITSADCLSSLINLEVLDMSNTLITNTDFLFDLINLQKLDLSYTQISTIGELSALTDLNELDLNHTQIKNLDNLSTLTNLKVLNLSDNSITTAECLSNLVNLQELDLGNTEITTGEFISKLTNLTELTLGNIQISNMAFLSTLKNLQHLDLTSSAITDLSPLANLSNLQTLLLGNTQITNVAPISDLKNLLQLSLWSTPITSTEGLSGLTSLKILSLTETELTDINDLSVLVNLERLYLSKSKIHILPPWLGNFKKLKVLHLEDLHLNSIPKEFLNLNVQFYVGETFAFQDGIFLNNSTLSTQPISLFEQPRELIQAYYDTEQVPINEAKVIFLGDGGAGKTHTIQRIHNHGKSGNYKTETTPGIHITKYKADAESKKFNINFWDFGGQEIMHAMHRCFLTDRTCYVIVISNRWDLNGRARYWLKNIDSFAKGAPVIIAVNRWDNIQEDGLDMNRLTKDYPNLVKYPVYYSAKNSSDSEFNMLVEAIIREAGKLDSTAMSFPAQWADIRQQLLEIAEEKYYIDKDIYHEICNEHGMESPHIRTWLLEWFNDLGVCFSYHQDEMEKNELASYKVLNPRWLTNAIYIIINEGKRYADKGRLHINTIQLLLQNPEFGVLSGVTYSTNERDYVLDVMRKFNLSYSVSEEIEFIPALCDSDTPEDLCPNDFTKHISYQMKYSYLPDSVVHQLMILSYKSLNPDKVWRKGLRLDIECVGLSAVVQMGDDDSTLRIDIYANDSVEPWKLLHNIRKDIMFINSNLSLKAEDFIIIHTNNGDIPKTVNELLDAKEQGIYPYFIYNSFSRKWESYSLDELLGMTFGNEIMTASSEKAKKDKQPLPIAFEHIETSVDSINLFSQCSQPEALKIIELLVQHNCETNAKLMDCLVNVLSATKNKEAEELAVEITKDFSEKRNFLKRIENHIKSAATIVTSSKTVYKGIQSVIDAVQEAYPQILELIPQIQETFENLPFIS